MTRYEKNGGELTGSVVEFTDEFLKRSGNLISKCEFAIDGAMSDIDGRMTWEEIRKRYSDQWVVMVEQELHPDDSSQLQTARVLTCGVSRAEAMKRANPAVKAFAGYGCRYTGETRVWRAESRAMPTVVLDGDLQSDTQGSVARAGRGAERVITTGEHDAARGAVAQASDPAADQAAKYAVTTGEHLTWAQICERYPERWGVMVDYDRLPHDSSEFRTARVLAAGCSRTEAKERARSQLDFFDEWGCHYTGPIRGPRLGHRSRQMP